MTTEQYFKLSHIKYTKLSAVRQFRLEESLIIKDETVAHFVERIGSLFAYVFPSLEYFEWSSMNFMLLDTLKMNIHKYFSQLRAFVPVYPEIHDVHYNTSLKSYQHAGRHSVAYRDFVFALMPNPNGIEDDFFQAENREIFYFR